VIIRRTALILLLSGALASASLVGFVKAETPAPAPSATPLPTTPDIREERRGPPLTEKAQRPVGPAENRASELDAILESLNQCGSPDPQLQLLPHCDAVKALLELVRGLGLASTSNPFPTCDPALIPLIGPMNLKVTTAIEFHKYSDSLLDNSPFRPNNRRLSPLRKSELTALSDHAIRRIVEILSQYFFTQGAYRSENAPVLFNYKELVVLAERVLNYNFELAQWGVDAGFLTGARGYVVYQYVFNCIRTQDPRLVAAQMSARAYAVWLAANSESYFNREAENLSKQRRSRPRYYRWLAVTNILEGGRGYGDGFPTGIYLGSNVRFRREFFEEQAQAPAPGECPRDAPVRNVYGYLKKTPNTPLLDKYPQLFPYTKYEPAEDPIRGWRDCVATINSLGLPGLSGLVIPGMRNFEPTGGLNVSDHRERLRRIAELINSYLRIVTARSWLEECDSSPTPPPADACKDLAQAVPQFVGPEQVVAAEETQQQSQETAEYKILERYSRYVRDSLSPLPLFEDLHRGPHK